MAWSIVRDAESALDQLIAFCGNKIGEKDVLSVFGLVAHDKLARLTDAIIDGQANTIWHTAYSDAKPSYPHELQLQFHEPPTIRGFKITPRQDKNRNGWIKDYAVYLSEDGQTWGAPAARG